jgi:hypothetical protein
MNCDSNQLWGSVFFALTRPYLFCNIQSYPEKCSQNEQIWIFHTQVLHSEIIHHSVLIPAGLLF